MNDLFTVHHFIDLKVVHNILQSSSSFVAFAFLRLVFFRCSERSFVLAVRFCIVTEFENDPFVRSAPSTRQNKELARQGWMNVDRRTSVWGLLLLIDESHDKSGQYGNYFTFE